MGQNKVILEVLKLMDSRIKTGIKSAAFQEQEDLIQDIHSRIVKVANEMESVSFWNFKKKFEEKTGNG